MAKDWLVRVFVVTLAYIILISSSEVSTQFHNGAPKCTLDNGDPGNCVPLRKCPSGLQRYRENRRKTMCWVRGYVPYICCDSNEENQVKSIGEISKSKCQEWYPKRRYWYGFGALIGGFRTLSKEFPHMAALGYTDGDDIRWACGGTLISETFVLTAAHCIKNKKLGEINKVRLGDLNLKLDTDDAKPKDFNVNRTIRHPDFKSSSQYNDIALIELSEKVEFNDYMKPACLQTTKDYYQYGELIATGWGNLEYTGPPAEHLMKVYLDHFDNNICNEFYKDANKRRLANGIDEKSQICAGGIEKDTCQGDSGGPLQVKNEHLSDGYTIIGITSFGKACGLTDSPGVYTRVSNYIKWIESIVWPK